MAGFIHKKNRFTSFQIIIGGFIAVILIGALLLMLPVSSKAGIITPFNEALFTSTSAVCVTGLVVQDTATYWSWFGQGIILVLIQIGGLGVITIAVSFALLSGRKISLMQRSVMQEAISAPKVGGIVRLTGFVLKGTFLVEFTASIIMMPVFVKDFGAKGIWMAIFHSISAFCNAGFDLMGINEEYSSFTKYAADPLVNITIMLLIIIGGIGFTIWNEVRTKKLKFSRYSLHAKIVISTTLILVFGGGLFMYIFEKNNTIAGMDTPGAIFASLFGSVTARTAGFNTVDTAALTQESKLLTIVLMFIGGSPGSTAGGIKTTTMAVMIIYIVSYMRGSNGCNVFGRKISSEVIKKAGMVLIINLVLGLTAVIAILATSNMKMDDVLFEVYSAISTVGMTTGITRDLNTVGRIIIIIMMYCGRIGSMTFVLSFVHRPDKANIELPEEKVIIG